MTLNLAQALNPAKVIKRNMNFDGPEKWQIPSERKKCEHGESEAAECLVRYHSFLLVCVWGGGETKIWENRIISHNRDKMLN